MIVAIRKYVPLILLIFLVSGCASRQVDRVLVKKSENKMYLMKYGEIVKAYDVGFGANPIGHKVQQGDMRTPEGRYDLVYKNSRSKFYKSIKISYPNEQDVAYAQSLGLDPGGDIVIHGLPNAVGNITGPISPQNWTEGCIAVRNHEMDEIWQLVELDTPIEIVP